ncbi:MAG: hypothetical protein ACRC57_08630 [Sarcina sp.]
MAEENNDNQITNENININNNTNINELDPFGILQNRVLQLELMISGMRRMNESLASLTIDETYKNFYEWRVKPAVEMIALLSSSASSAATVADLYSNNVYSTKKEVKKALKISHKLLDEIETGLSLYKSEINCMLEFEGLEK